jgi:OOP family OmpA-OmpF porin
LTKSTTVSTEGIDFILTYLRNNASVDIIGHAGIRKNCLQWHCLMQELLTLKDFNERNWCFKIECVIAAEDNSVEKDSEGARKLVRKVTFRIK